jgi:hypothetical protein
VKAEAWSMSKSAVSRSFVAKTRTALEELLGRDLSDLELAVVMIDGIDLADVTHVVALGLRPMVRSAAVAERGLPGERDRRDRAAG